MSVDTENLMPIGEFASASRLSQKALRLYGENGLLPPAWVDPESGYRYYRIEQLRAATLIALLRRGGLSLGQIREFLRDPSLERLEEYERRATDEFAERRRVLRYVKRILKEEPMYDVLTKRVDEQRYASRSKRVLVPELESFICSMFDELGQSDDGPPFVLYHGSVNTEEDGPVEVCVPKTDGNRRLPAGEVAFTEISGGQCEFPEILGAYVRVPLGEGARPRARRPSARDLPQRAQGRAPHGDRGAAALSAKIRVVRTEVVVVGAGIMGCAAARALARDGQDVVLLEQFRVGHRRGSSHGRSRIFRLAYPELEWVRLAEEAMRGWRELERDAQTELLELNGLLELVEDPAQSTRDTLEAAGVQSELLDAAEARRRWPIGIADGWTALFQPDAGIVRADLAHRAFVDRALAHGARLEEKTRVESLDDLDAKAVVVTAGSWVTKLVPDLPVRPTRETLAYFRRDGAPLPSIAQLDPETRGHVLYSLHDPRYGLKAGVHQAGASADPDEPGEPDPTVLERVAEWVVRTYPDADPEPVDAETCMYTNTEDERFILERRGRVVIGSACSGHGFKFAPAIGNRLAALVADIL